MILWSDDYVGDTSHLTTTQNGAYFMLLAAMLRNGGSLQNDDEYLALVVKQSLNHWRGMKDKILTFFAVSGDGTTLTHRRLILDMQKAFRVYRQSVQENDDDGQTDHGVPDAHGEPVVVRRPASEPVEPHRNEQDAKKEYVIENGKFRITTADFQKFKEAYPHINVMAYLMRASDFAMETWGERNWWMALKAWLHREDKQAQRENLRIQADAKAKADAGVKPRMPAI